MPHSSDETAQLEAGVAHHRAGRFDAARRCYEAVLAGNPDHPEALHLLGFLHAFQGRAGEGAALLSRAVALAPRFPAALNHLGLALKAQGKLDDATDCFRRAVAVAPDFAEAHINLGNVLLERDDADAALASFREALRIAPNFALAHNNLGSVLFKMGRWREAIACFRRAVEIDDAYAEAHKNLGNALLDAARADEAIASFQRALAIKPDFADAHFGLGKALSEQGRYDEAVSPFRRALELNPLNGEARLKLGVVLMRSRVAAINPAAIRAEAERHLAEAARVSEQASEAAPDDWRPLSVLGSALLRLGRVDEAFAARARETAIFRRPGASPSGAMATFRRTSRGKLDHDIEQIEYLMARGRLGAEGAALLEAYKAARAGLVEPVPGTHLVDLGADARRAIGATYNRLWHLAPAPTLPGAAVAPTLDRPTIEADYHDRAPGITWFDGLLTEDALSSLRRFCLESTVWSETSYANGYLGAFGEDGFSCPLLAQIARELPERLPGIFGDHRLLKVWAFKYGANPDGIGLHADFAAINVNFWITPDDANLDPDSGGLVVWDKEAPAHWDFQTYNNDQTAMRAFIAESGAKPYTIPYRQNRAVVFNSDLIHRTDAIRFRPGYENRRINVTFLYGERSGRV